MKQRITREQQRSRERKGNATEVERQLARALAPAVIADALASLSHEVWTQRLFPPPSSPSLASSNRHAPECASRSLSERPALKRSGMTSRLAAHDELMRIHLPRRNDMRCTTPFHNALSSAHWCVALVFLASTASANDAAPSNGANAPAPERHGSAFVDPLGFLLFGPRLGVELGAGQVSGGIYGRWFNPGVLAHTLFLGAGDE